MRHSFWPWAAHPERCLICGKRRRHWKHCQKILRATGPYLLPAAMGAVVFAALFMLMPDHLFTVFMTLVLIGYFGIPALAFWSYRLTEGQRLLAGLLGWVFFIVYTIVAIHTAQTYYHPKG